MPTSTSQPAVDTITALTGLDAIPWAYRCLAGIMMIALGASVLTSQLRSAFPSTDGPTAKRLTFLYPSLIGMLMGEGGPFLLPGFGWDSRWLIGLLSPALGILAYEYYWKPRAERKLGATLPSVGDIVSGAPPAAGEKKS